MIDINKKYLQIDNRQKKFGNNKYLSGLYNNYQMSNTDNAKIKNKQLLNNNNQLDDKDKNGLLKNNNVYKLLEQQKQNIDDILKRVKNYDSSDEKYFNQQQYDKQNNQIKLMPWKQELQDQIYKRKNENHYYLQKRILTEGQDYSKKRLQSLNNYNKYQKNKYYQRIKNYQQNNISALNITTDHSTNLSPDDRNNSAILMGSQNSPTQQLINYQNQLKQFKTQNIDQNASPLQLPFLKSKFGQSNFIDGKIQQSKRKISDSSNNHIYDPNKALDYDERVRKLEQIKEESLRQTGTLSMSNKKNNNQQYQQFLPNNLEQITNIDLENQMNRQQRFLNQQLSNIQGLNSNRSNKSIQRFRSQSQNQYYNYQKRNSFTKNEIIKKIYQYQPIIDGNYSPRQNMLRYSQQQLLQDKNQLFIDQQHLDDYDLQPSYMQKKRSMSHNRRKYSLTKSLNKQSRKLLEDRQQLQFSYDRQNRLENYIFPPGLNSAKYYQDFYEIVQNQSLETLRFLNDIYQNSESKTQDELFDKIDLFKNNFQLIAEKQDRTLRELKYKYHHCLRFELPQELIGIENIQTD